MSKISKVLRCVSARLGCVPRQVEIMLIVFSSPYDAYHQYAFAALSAMSREGFSGYGIHGIRSFMNYLYDDYFDSLNEKLYCTDTCKWLQALVSWA